MAFSQRARAYTLNPTLPCPTLPLSPHALSDSSVIPAAGRLCLKLYLHRLYMHACMSRAMHVRVRPYPSATRPAKVKCVQVRQKQRHPARWRCWASRTRLPTVIRGSRLDLASILARSACISFWPRFCIGRARPPHSKPVPILFGLRLAFLWPAISH